MKINHTTKLSENNIQPSLQDSFGRTAKKLRISVTDRCNLRCMYCMPQGNDKWFDRSDILTYEEIERLVRIFVKLGIEKVRITGGEPLLRADIEKLVAKLAKIDGLKSISMTTNGLLFSQKAKQLREAGLTSVNISLDTFRPDVFKKISGTEGLEKILKSIKDANKIGLKVKVNTVIIRGQNDDEILDFARFARDTNNLVRFIEFMPLDGTGIWKRDLVVTKKEIMDTISKNTRIELQPISQNNSEPASIYQFRDGIGMLGFIPSITEPFCGNCDRVRITSDGRFLTCLFENPGNDVKNLMRSTKSDDYILNHILEAMQGKPEGIIKLIRSDQLKPKLNLMHTIGG
ncbi:MAG: GTP 3',8-cyclase MoaA [Thaumarchaeota archaeon]|nr:GTP 3',8-cyclase MoaA [Nitrososphaerota archaeon]